MPGTTSRWYRGRLVVGPFPPFETGEVEALEQETGLALPESYRSFLEAAGGSHLDYAVRIPACEPDQVQAFVSLNRLGRNTAGEYGGGTLIGEYRRCSNWWLADEVPLAGLLPIAADGGSNTLFLDLNPATYGRVHAFVHGVPWPGRLQHGVFTEVAEDFDAYLASLVVDPTMAEFAWGEVAGSDPTDSARRTVEEWLDHGLAGWRAEPWAADGPSAGR